MGAKIYEYPNEHGGCGCLELELDGEQFWMPLEIIDIAGKEVA